MVLKYEFRHNVQFACHASYSVSIDAKAPENIRKIAHNQPKTSLRPQSSITGIHYLALRLESSFLAHLCKKSWTQHRLVAKEQCLIVSIYASLWKTISMQKRNNTSRCHSKRKDTICLCIRQKSTYNIEDKMIPVENSRFSVGHWRCCAPAMSTPAQTQIQWWPSKSGTGTAPQLHVSRYIRLHLRQHQKNVKLGHSGKRLKFVESSTILVY